MRAKSTEPRKAETFVPAQGKGGETETPEAVTASSEKEAIRIFLVARDRLLNVNHWDSLCGPLSAGFRLTDEAGHPMDADAKVGNYIRIDLPGPGTAEGQGFDWVKIEKIEYHPVLERYELFLLQARPSPQPGKMGEAGSQGTIARDTAHFFEQSATSSFIVERDGLNVSATVYGRNEIPNMSASHVADKVRNAVIGIAGAAGVSKLQWRALVKGLLKK
ncbi:MAG TPA: hypothetical protein VK563_24325 [Puia sp.]|nr:hypothetical protein [Puia sp.]